jgi:broad specificity phosphatase PhoE
MVLFFYLKREAVQMSRCGFLVFILISLVSQNVLALSERHMIVIRSAEAKHNVEKTFNADPRQIYYEISNLTTRGKQQAKSSAERLAMHGFDNRNIVAVYVSPLPRAMQTAMVMSGYGIFSADKIYSDTRLNNAFVGSLENKSQRELKQDPWHLSQETTQKYELESNRHVRSRMLALYDDIEKKHPKGHVLIIGHGMPEMELLQEIVQAEVRLKPGDAYILPLIERSGVNQRLS